MIHKIALRRGQAPRTGYRHGVWLRVLGLVAGMGVSALLSAAPASAETTPRLHRTPGYMRDIDVGANGRIYGLGGRDYRSGNGLVYRWMGTNWAPLSGWGTKITVDREGNPWLVNDAHEIWRFREGRWTKLPGRAIDIDAGANGDVYILGTDNPRPGEGSVYRWHGEGWTFIGGWGRQITVDRGGNVWLVNGSREIWCRRGGRWERVAGRAQAIDAGADGSVWTLGVDDAPAGNGALHRWDGAGWTSPGGYGRAITVAQDGVPAVINSRDEIWSGFFTGRSAEQLGYGSLTVNGSRMVGTHPVLVVLVEYQDVRFRSPHTAAYFDDLLFEGDRNLTGYYQDNSGANFTLSKAGMLGPLVHPLRFECAHRRSSCAGNDGKSFRAAYAEVLQSAQAAAFPFARYDSDGNGRVTPDELLVVIVTALAAPATGGINRELPGGCTMVGSPGVQLCGKMALIAEGTGFATLAHELSHSFGTADIYGARIRNNTWMSVMAGTILKQEDAHRYVHLDPWHKMRLGWVKPRIEMMSLGGKTKRLTLAVPGSSSEDARPVLLYDPRRARSEEIEYFLIEFRNRAPGGTARYDADLARSGVVIWHVRQKANHGLADAFLVVEPGADDRLDTPVQPGSDDRVSWLGITAGPDRILQTRPRAGTDDKLGHDAANWVVAPDGTLGASQAWQGTEPATELRWLNNTRTGATVRVLPFDAGASSAVLEISYSHRLDPVVATRPAP